MNEFPFIYKLPNLFTGSKNCHFNSRPLMVLKDIPSASHLHKSIGFERSKNVTESVTKHLIRKQGWNDSCPPGVLYIGQQKLSMVYYYPTQYEYA